LLAATSLPVAAASMNHWSLGVEAGSTGFGASASYRFHDNLALTAGYSGFTYDNLDYETDDARYDGDLDADIYGLTLDYFPFGGRFFLSAGALRPDVSMDVTGRPATGTRIEYGGTSYSLDDIEALEGEVTLSDGLQPYLGIGWRGSHKTGLGVFAKLGAFLTDTEVDLRSRFALNDRLRDSLEGEEQDLRDEVDDYKIYPVAVLGLEYTF
jgi:hypothetical protein